MEEPRWLDARELATWEAFLAVSAILDRRLDQQLKNDAALSHSQYEVLTRLSTAPGGELRMTELADAALSSKSGLTYQVIQLEKAGLVRRCSSPHDERGVIAMLTEEGWRRLRAAAPGHVAIVRELFFDGLTPAQLTGLAKGINALHQRLRHIP